MILIVGLGNPGNKHIFNRHNIGFIACDIWLQSIGGSAQSYKNEHKALVTKSKIRNGPNEQDIVIAKPQTYMNLSGESVVSLMNFYKIDKSKLLVVHDDIDQPFGGLKLQYKRGHGGQNGVRNISELLGGNDYYRLKLGVGRPPHPEFSVADYVLSNFNKSEQPVLDELLDKACGAIDSFIWDGPEKAASRFNT